jgi:hypothetical protein
LGAVIQKYGPLPEIRKFVENVLFGFEPAAATITTKIMIMNIHCFFLQYSGNCSSSSGSSSSSSSSSRV